MYLRKQNILNPSPCFKDLRFFIQSMPEKEIISGFSFSFKKERNAETKLLLIFYARAKKFFSCWGAQSKTDRRDSHGRNFSIHRSKILPPFLTDGRRSSTRPHVPVFLSTKFKADFFNFAACEGAMQDRPMSLRSSEIQR